MASDIKLTTSDNFLLDTEYMPVDGSSKAIIFAHGITVDRDEEGIFVRSAPLLNKKGFTTLRFDFRGHGKSQGDSIKDFTVSGQLDDLKSAIEYLQKEGISWIGIAGASFGGGASALYASSHQEIIKKLLLINPVLNYEKAFLNPTTQWAKKYFSDYKNQLAEKGFVTIGSHGFKAGKQLFEEMEHYYPSQAIKTYDNPLLIVHGDRDSYVGYEDVWDCYNSLSNQQKEFVTMTGAEHGLHQEPFETETTNLIVDFFSKI